jgi:hypothetical protein
VQLGFGVPEKWELNHNFCWERSPAYGSTSMLNPFPVCGLIAVKNDKAFAGLESARFKQATEALQLYGWSRYLETAPVRDSAGPF